MTSPVLASADDQPSTLSDNDEIAGHLYEVYCKAVGGVAFNNDPLPDWTQFSKDPNKQKQANAWREVALASL